MKRGIVEDDLAGRYYWNDVWSGESLAPPIDPDDPSWRHYVDRRFHAFFSELFRSGSSSTLIEVGCGGSVMLPYLAKTYGFDVSGIDYSEEGCAKARAALEREGVRGVIHQADLFTPPEDLMDASDVAVSFGLVEHFTDTVGCLRAVSRLARPGGLIVTFIPNMRGVPGAIQKRFNRAVWDAHVPLSEDELRSAHESAGLEVGRSGYFIGTNFGVNNLNGLDPKLVSTRLKRLALKVLNLASLVSWRLEGLVRAEVPSSALLSPYLFAVGRRSE